MNTSLRGQDYMLTLQSGQTARYETVRDGLVPCRVISIIDHGAHPPIGEYPDVNVTIKVTRNQAGYKAGEIITSTAWHVIPTAAVWRKKYKTIILPYRTVVD